jgi:hypothetical protein
MLQLSKEERRGTEQETQQNRRGVNPSQLDTLKTLDIVNDGINYRRWGKAVGGRQCFGARTLSNWAIVMKRLP